MSSKVASQLLRLIPRAVNYESVGGALSELTGPEVAAILSGISAPDKDGAPPQTRRIMACMVRARVLDYHYDEQEVRSWILDAVNWIASQDGWGGIPDERKRLMAVMIGHDFYPRRCLECKGRKTIPNEKGIPVDCPACGGSGKNYKSNAEKAKALGVSEATFYRSWNGRIGSVLDYVQALEAEAFWQVGKKIERGY